MDKAKHGSDAVYQSVSNPREEFYAGGRLIFGVFIQYTGTFAYVKVTPLVLLQLIQRTSTRVFQHQLHFIKSNYIHRLNKIFMSSN